MNGRGALAIDRVNGASVVARASARSPLRLVPTRNHGDAAWVFTVGLGGGLVDGDALVLDVAVAAGAALLLATQSATKVYRSAGGTSQRLTAEVGAGGLLCLLADPLLCFAGARYQQRLEIDLAAGASLILVDGLASGRAACGERWAFASYASRIVVRRDGREVAFDRVVLDPAQGAVAERLGRWDALATVVALGPRAAPLLGDLLAGGTRPTRRADRLIAPSRLEDGAIVRLAATSGEGVTLATRRLLAGLAGLLGDDPFARRH